MSDPAAGDLTNSVGMCVLSPSRSCGSDADTQYDTLILSHVFHLGLLGFEILGLDFWISGAAWFSTDKLVQILGSQGGYQRA
jgi:hypothetical protein